MDRKPPRRPDGHSSSRPQQRGPSRPYAEGDARPPRRESSDRFRDDRPRGDRPPSDRPTGDRPRGDRPQGDRPRGDRPQGDRFESRGPRPDGDRGGRNFTDRGSRDSADRPARPARAEWQSPGDAPRNDRPRFDKGDRPRFDRGDRPRFDDRRPRDDRPRGPVDEDAGNRMDQPPRNEPPRFDDRRPRAGGFGGRRDERPSFGDRGDRPRFGDRGPREGGYADRPRRDERSSFGDRPRRDDRPDRPRFDDRPGRDERPRNDDRSARDDRSRGVEERPRKEKIQVWNKEMPPLGSDAQARGDRSTLKLSNKPEVIERKIYGVNACLSFFAQRPADIIRGYFTETVARQHFGDLMKFLAQGKMAYHIVPGDDMERITESTHHEGVCLLVRDQPAESFFHWLDTNPTAQTQAQCMLALEDIGNPHNLGAIMRVAAHFGAKAIVVKDAALARSGAAMRTAEGGAEHVQLLEAGDFERMLAACRREGYTIVSTSSHDGASLFEQPLPQRALILFGQESKGLSETALENSDLKVRIPGTRQVESLNVSVAAGIILAEYWRHHGVLTPMDAG